MPNHREAPKTKPGLPVARPLDAKAARAEREAQREEIRKRRLKVRSAGERDLARPELRRHAPTPMKRRVVDARTSEEARQVEQAETTRMMTNWVMWKSGSSISVAVSSAFDLEARGRREAVSVPLMNGEAADVDAAVDALPPELHQVIVAHWLDQFTDRQGKTRKGKSASVEQRARACACSVPTYYRRLEHAHDRIRALLRAKRDQAERAREQYRSKKASVREAEIAPSMPESFVKPC